MTRLPFIRLLAINREMKHQHLAIPNHSIAQAHLFFALAADLNYPTEMVKRRAKLHYGVTCFNVLDVSQMNWLIERLLEKVAERSESTGR